ncbi:MAG TPA: hypothetical protein DIU39_05655 [Flavobacteriales bacterium]|nr:hypothetical protein [Flavobacteriales bacterium]|tara:strand:+ start:48895 stop:49422 length:528 start_codon:yes stop_codon:yes gene_type:complete
MTVDENIYIGRVSKIAKNTKEITVFLEVDFLSKPKFNEPIFVRMNESDQVLVPFFIKFHHLDKNKLRLEIDDISHPEDLLLLKDKAVYLSKSFKNIIEQNYQEELELEGFKVIDEELGEIGMVNDVMDIKKNPLLSVQTNEDKEIFIPLNERFILGINPDEQTVYVSIPEDLLNL